MSAATFYFQKTLVRMLKGCLDAWDKWLDAQKGSDPSKAN